LYYPEEIKKATNIDYNIFKNKITKIQDNAVRRLAKTCNLNTVSNYLAKIAGEK
jgi:hypothetical protein